jgi:hypothetical protein
MIDPPKPMHCAGDAEARRAYRDRFYATTAEFRLTR